MTNSFGKLGNSEVTEMDEVKPLGTINDFELMTAVEHRLPEIQMRKDAYPAYFYPDPKTFGYCQCYADSREMPAFGGSMLAAQMVGLESDQKLDFLWEFPGTKRNELKDDDVTIKVIPLTDEQQQKFLSLKRKEQQKFVQQLRRDNYVVTDGNKVNVPFILWGQEREAYLAWQKITEGSGPQTLIAIDNRGHVFRCDNEKDIAALGLRKDSNGFGSYPFRYEWYAISTELLKDYVPKEITDGADEALAVENWKHRIKLDLLGGFDAEKVSRVVEQLPEETSKQIQSTYSTIDHDMLLVKVLFKNDHPDELILSFISETYVKNSDRDLGKEPYWFHDTSSPIINNWGFAVFMSPNDLTAIWKFRPDESAVDFEVKPLNVRHRSRAQPLRRLFAHKIEEYCRGKFSGEFEIEQAKAFVEFYRRLFEVRDEKPSITSLAQTIVDSGDGVLKKNRRALNTVLKSLCEWNEEAFVDLIYDIAACKHEEDSHISIPEKQVILILEADIVKEHCLSVTVKRQFKKLEKAVLTYDGSIVREAQWKKDFFKFLQSNYSELTGEVGTKAAFEELLGRDAVQGLDLVELNRLKDEAAEHGHGDLYEDYISLYCLHQLLDMDEGDREAYLKLKVSTMAKIINSADKLLVARLVQHTKDNRFVLQGLIDESTLDQLQEYKSRGQNDNNSSADLRVSGQQTF